MIDTGAAAFMLQCSVSHIKKLVAGGVLTDYSPNRKRIEVSVSQMDDLLEKGIIRARPKYGRTAS